METNERLDKIFFALADLGAISKHLTLLESAELIYKTRQGRYVYCHMNFDIWKEVASYISMQARFWNNRLDELEQYINTGA